MAPIRIGRRTPYIAVGPCRIERQGEKESKRFRVSSSILWLIVGIGTESAGTQKQFQLRHTPVGVRICDDAGRFLVSQSLFEKRKENWN
jgi:hypothetical protein